MTFCGPIVEDQETAVEDQEPTVEDQETAVEDPKPLGSGTLGDKTTLYVECINPHPYS